jgi:hypothetical protein
MDVVNVEHQLASNSVTVMLGGLSTGQHKALNANL